MKWEKVVKKIVIECWIRNESTKIKYKQQMKNIYIYIYIYNEIGVFPVTEQRLADRARQVRTKKWLTNMGIGMRKKWESDRKETTVQ